MSEYIEREALLKNVQTYSMEFGEYIGEDVRDIDAILADRVKDAPAADVSPVARGRWIETQSIFRCLMTSMVTNDQSSLWSGKNAAIVRDCITAPKKEEK